MDKIVCRPIATGRRGELPAKNGRTARCTENSGRVRVREIQPPGGKPIQVRRDCPRCRLQTADPVIHVIDSEEQDVWLLVGKCLRRAERKEQDQPEDSIHDVATVNFLVLGIGDKFTGKKGGERQGNDELSPYPVSPLSFPKATARHCRENVAMPSCGLVGDIQQPTSLP